MPMLSHITDGILSLDKSQIKLGAVVHACAPAPERLRQADDGEFQVSLRHIEVFSKEHDKKMTTHSV